MPDGTGPAGGPRYSVPGSRAAAPSARRRRRTRSVSGPVGVLSVGTCPGLTVRSCSSGLDTLVPAADPPTPLGIGLAAVLPRTLLRVFPRVSTSWDSGRWPFLPGADSIRFRFPSPCSAWRASWIVVWGPSTARREIPTNRWYFHSGRGWCAQNNPQTSPLGPVGRKWSGPPG